MIPFLFSIAQSIIMLAGPGGYGSVPQTLTPASTITVGNWTPTHTTLYGDTSDNNNITYIKSGTVEDSVCELKFSSGTDPLSSTGHTVTFFAQAYAGGGGPETLDAWLYQGSTLIIQTHNNLAMSRGSWAEYGFTLAAAEADSITDYTDLRMRFTADAISGSEEVYIHQIEMDLP